MLTPVYYVKYEHQNEKPVLVLEADLDLGWGRLLKTFGFFHCETIPFRNDLSFRTQLGIISQPAGYADWAKSFPDVELAEVNEFRSWKVLRKRLTVKIPLEVRQPWRKMSNGRVGLYFEEIPLFNLDHTKWYELRTQVVFHDPAGRPVEDVRVWTENALVVPAGQFESNRSKH